jgi:hypothetical protein
MDKEGEVVEGSDAVRTCFRDHFQRVLNVDVGTRPDVPAPQTEPPRQPALQPPTLEETEAGIKALTRGRCADRDGVWAEALKQGGPKVVDALQKLFSEACMGKRVP